MKPFSATLIVCLFFLGGNFVSADEPKPETEKRRIIDTHFYSVVSDKSDPPVFEYSGPRGHHGQRISKAPIDAVLVWADGTIFWKVMKDDDWFADGWVQATIPVEKVEKAVRAIVEDFKRYPVENRPLDTAIRYRLGVNYSPHITVMAPELFENLWMDEYLLRHYEKKREDFRSGDEEKMIHAMMELNNSFVKFTGIVEHYRKTLPQAGLSKVGEERISDEELKKCAELFAADAEHLLLMEKQVLELVPSHEGLKPKDRDYKSRDVKIEREITDGKKRFFYAPITEKEKKAIWEERRKRQGR